MLLKTAIVGLCMTLSTAGFAAERKNAPPRAQDKGKSVEMSRTAKPTRSLPTHEPTLRRCGGGASSLCVHPVF